MDSHTNVKCTFSAATAHAHERGARPRVKVMVAQVATHVAATRTAAALQMPTTSAAPPAAKLALLMTSKL